MVCYCKLTEGSGDQRLSSVPSISQPNSFSNCQPNQQSYQPWDQQQQQQHENTDMSGHMSSRSPELADSEPSTQTERTPEEEAYWAEMTGKKVRKGDHVVGFLYCIIRSLMCEHQKALAYRG